MKNRLFTCLVISSGFFMQSCKKQNNIYLAKNYYEQSLVEADEKNVPKALQLVNQSIEIAPTPQALALKATLFYQNNDYEKSLEIYKKLLKDKETPMHLKSDIINNLACTYLALGNKEEAKRAWLSLTTNSNYLSPEVAWFNLGLLELSNTQNLKLEDPACKDIIKNSQRYFSKALSIANEYIDAFYYLALTHMYLKQFNKAKEVIISLLSVMPDHEPAKELLDLANKGLHDQLNEKLNQR